MSAINYNINELTSIAFGNANLRTSMYVTFGLWYKREMATQISSISAIISILFR